MFSDLSPAVQTKVLPKKAMIFLMQSLNMGTPADVYFGSDLEILARREIIEQRILQKRRLAFEVQKTTLI
jgi:hypothetical protein